ncbi:MAG: D-glycero-alpha-D-manno-heptose-1,7-bisphosphate 7-phosphatase [Bdellovibrionales bacterium]
MAKKIIFFDRDGTIIDDKIYLNDVNQVEYLPDVFEALQLLKEHSYEFVIVTNQSGIPRGLVQEENLFKIHDKIAKDFKEKDIHFLGFYYAPYLVESGNPLRKPGTGMVELAESEHGPFDYSSSWFVGDRMTDVECGHRMGMRTIFLHGSEDPKESDYKQPEIVSDNLLEACKHLVKGLA